MDLHKAFSALLLERHSCRRFLSTEVDRETISEIFRLAQCTASWCNAQPWNVVITSGDATKRFVDTLRVAVETHPPSPDFLWPIEYEGVYGQRRRECAMALYQSVGIAKGDREASKRQTMENYSLFGAPHVALITTDQQLGIYGAVDCGAFVSNFMLAAKSLGVSCVAQAALAARPDIVRRHFELPRNRLVVCGISFGFEDLDDPANKFRTIRANLSEVVSWRD